MTKYEKNTLTSGTFEKKRLPVFTVSWHNPAFTVDSITFRLNSMATLQHDNF